MKEQQYEKTLNGLNAKQQEEIQELKAQYESIVGSLRTKIKEISDQREEEISQLNEHLINHQLESERLRREAEDAVKEVKRLQSFVREDQLGVVDEKIAQYERLIQQLEDKIANSEIF